MKTLLSLILVTLFAIPGRTQDLNGSEADRISLDKATLAIRDAFAKGDAALVAQLHHTQVVKYFGGNNVVRGRAALEKGLIQMFRNSKVEFTENTVESTVFNGTTAIQSVIFGMKVTPKAGGPSVTNRGRSVVVYVRDKTSPTGWYSLREVAQEAPPKNN